MDCFFYKISRWSVAWLTVSAASLCLASDEDLLFDTQRVPTVLSASKLPQLQTEAPASITIIDRQLIEASGATQVADLFRLVPGMQVGNARGNFPVVAYQGLTSEFPQGIQVIIDGSSIYSPLFGGVIWNNLPIHIEDIERIEVVRGANSASFGANAFQGIINITTSHASQPHGLTASVRHNDKQDKRAFLRYADSSQNNWVNYRLSLSSETTDNYKKLADDVNKNTLSSRVDVRINHQDTLQFNASLVDSKRQTQHPDLSSPLLAIDPKRSRKESSQFAQVKWERNKDQQQLSARLSFNHFDGKDKYVEQLSGSALDLSTESTDWSADIEQMMRLNNHQRFVWGTGAAQEAVYAPFRLNHRQLKKNTRIKVFGNLETQLTDRLLINTGALIEKSQLSGTSASPRISANYLSSPHHAYRLTATQAFRAPVITEEDRLSFLLGSQIQSSAGHLKPETVNSIELGYHGLYLKKHLNVDVKAFQNVYKELINNSINDTVSVIDNLDSATVQGIEFEIGYRLNHRDLLHLSYAATDIKQASNQRLNDSIPRHNFSALWSHQFTTWQAGIEYYYQSNMQYLGPQNILQPRYQRLDLSLKKQLKLPRKHAIDIRLDVQLALDKNIDFHQAATANNIAYLTVGYRYE